MNAFTKKQMQYLNDRMREVKETAGSCGTTRELLIAIYRESLPDKSEKQAALMADETIGGGTGFYEDLDAARKDRDGFIDRKLEELTAGQSLVQRCNTLQQIQSVLLAMNLDSMGDLLRGEVRKEDIPLRPEQSIPEEMATEELAEELAASVRTALNHSAFLFHTMPQQADILDQIAQDGPELVLDMGMEELDYLAVLSMLAYTSVKSGEFPEISEDVTMRQISTMICAVREQEKAAVAAEEEGWVESVLTEALELIGLVGIINLGFSAVMVGSVLVGVVSPAPLAVLSSCLLAYCCTRALMKGYEWWKTDCRKAAGVIIKSTRVVAAGLRKLYAFIKEHMLPACAAAARSVWERIRAGVGSKEAGTYTDAEQTDIYEDGFEKRTKPVPAT